MGFKDYKIAIKCAKFKLTENIVFVSFNVIKIDNKIKIF